MFKFSKYNDLAVFMAAGVVAGMAAGYAWSAQAEETSRLTLRGNLSPRSQAEARQLFQRIDAAALEVCGASSFDLVLYQRAVRASTCYHDAVAQTLSQLHSAQLAALPEVRQLAVRPADFLTADRSH